jgi:hypothetical protein
VSRTLTISDELYDRLDSEARSRGLRSIENLLDEWGRSQEDLRQRRDAVKKIDDLRENLFAKYGQMPDSTALVREDRARNT